MAKLSRLWTEERLVYLVIALAFGAVLYATILR
jgi:hypothetical protein